MYEMYFRYISIPPLVLDFLTFLDEKLSVYFDTAKEKHIIIKFQISSAL